MLQLQSNIFIMSYNKKSMMEDATVGRFIYIYINDNYM